MIRVTFALFFGSALLLLPAQTPELTLSGAAAQLAARTSSLLPRRATVSLELQNLTPLPAAEWSSFRNLLRDELRKAGLETAATQPESRLRVTLSEDARGLLFVAEVSWRQSANRHAALELAAAAQSKPRISITKNAALGSARADPRHPAGKTRRKSTNAGSERKQGLDLSLHGRQVDAICDSVFGVASATASRPTRDGWKRRRTRFRAYSAGRDVRGNLETRPHADVRQWKRNFHLAGCQAALVADRNELESGSDEIAVYATAADGVFAMPDGRVQDRAGQPIPGSDGLGQRHRWDRRSLRRRGSSGDRQQCEHGARRDTRIRSRERASHGRPGDAATAAGASDRAMARGIASSGDTVVVRNLQTGEYEASRLGLACSQ